MESIHQKSSLVPSAVPVVVHSLQYLSLTFSNQLWQDLEKCDWIAPKLSLFEYLKTLGIYILFLYFNILQHKAWWVDSLMLQSRFLLKFWAIPKYLLLHLSVLCISFRLSVVINKTFWNWMHCLCSVDIYRSCNVEYIPSCSSPLSCLKLTNISSWISGHCIFSSITLITWYFLIGFYSFPSDNYFAFFLSLNIFFQLFCCIISMWSSTSPILLLSLESTHFMTTQFKETSSLYRLSFPGLILLKEIKLLANISKTSRMQVKARPPWKLL